MALLVHGADQIPAAPHPLALEGPTVAEDHRPALSPKSDLGGVARRRAGGAPQDVHLLVLGIDDDHVADGDLLFGQLVQMGLAQDIAQIGPPLRVVLVFGRCISGLVDNLDFGGSLSVLRRFFGELAA